MESQQESTTILKNFIQEYNFYLKELQKNHSHLKRKVDIIRQNHFALLDNNHINDSQQQFKEIKQLLDIAFKTFNILSILKIVKAYRYIRRKIGRNFEKETPVIFAALKCMY